jgi:hypothetical protein
MIREKHKTGSFDLEDGSNMFHQNINNCQLTGLRNIISQKLELFIFITLDFKQMRNKTNHPQTIVNHQ